MEVRHEKFTTNYTKVSCEDQPWNYNAPHHFTVSNINTDEVVAKVDFQEGPIKEVGINGVSNEDLLLMVVTRLEGFQNSEYKCEENQKALESILDAVDHLRSRTNKRVERGVEGTSTV